MLLVNKYSPFGDLRKSPSQSFPNASLSPCVTSVCRGRSGWQSQMGVVDMVLFLSQNHRSRELWGTLEGIWLLEAWESKLQSKIKVRFLDPLPTIPISPLRHHLLLFFMSLALLQPPWPPGCSLNTPTCFQPQGLCADCFLCLELFQNAQVANSLISFESVEVSLSHCGLLWPLYLKITTLSPYPLRI